MATPLEKWVEKQAKLAEPDKIHWCDGSEEEARWIIEKGIKEEKIEGKPVFYELNHKNWPNAYLHRSHPTDVARTEKSTIVCYPDKDISGPNNNWMSPMEAKNMLKRLSKGCMKGRTMYIMPFIMGHPDSPHSKLCVQITDISYVAVSMRIMTRMGAIARNKIASRDDFIKLSLIHI